MENGRWCDSPTVNVKGLAKFAFIVHPIDSKQLTRVSIGFGWLGHLPYVVRRKLLDFQCGVKVSTIPFNLGFTSTQCVAIVCPMFPREMVVNEKRAVTKIVDAIRMAKDCGAQLVGLGGFTSIVGDNGLRIAERSPLPVTSGNTYTTVVILQSLLEASRLLRVDLRSTCVAVIGATGDIGSACTRELSRLCGSLILVARNEEKLHLLCEDLREGCTEVKIERRTNDAAAQADVIVMATSAYTTLLEPECIKTGAIVCDASYPANVAKGIRNKRDDIFIYEGGIVTWPKLRGQIQTDQHVFWQFNPPNGAHGCFAETLLLALEGKAVTYSIGRGHISVAKMKEISSLASKYRFVVAPPWYDDKAYTSEEIIAIRNARNLESTAGLGAREEDMRSLSERLSLRWL